ncbi:MAG TPA: sigma-70 family RNA polymerase sigma factor, partial [Solirubrobacteraceae bacterium]|nr:sigma-70 family RNA polymerase sigma factor [Solirubrobacteraceae bacterium]
MTSLIQQGPGPLQTSEAADRRERRLLQRWHQFRDVQARDELVHLYLPFARRLARRYARTSESMEDLVQVASLGLVKALDRYDPSRGTGFAGFATPTILGELRRHFRDATWAVHVPRAVKERSLQVTSARRALTAELGRSPTMSELSQFLEIDDEQVMEALQASRASTTVSVDAERDEDDAPLLGTLGAEDERL